MPLQSTAGLLQELAIAPSVVPGLPKLPVPELAEGKAEHTEKGRLHMARSNASTEEKPPNWPPKNEKLFECDPPCIHGRGVCNNKKCFCKSPYAGSTCQHKETGLYRAPRV